MFEEKRKFPRLPIELEATYTLPRVSDNYGVAKTLNISREGFCLRTEEEVSEGRILRLILEIADNECVLLDTQIVWSNNCNDGYIVGTQIIDDQSPDYSKFKTFLEYKSKTV